MYKVRIENTETGKTIEAKTDLALITVGNYKEDGLIASETFLGTLTEDEWIRLHLMEARAIQHSMYGHISKEVGAIVDNHLFKDVE